MPSPGNETARKSVEALRRRIEAEAPATVAAGVEIFAALTAYKHHLAAERRLLAKDLTADQWAVLSDRSWGRLREFRAIVRGLIGAKAPGANSGDPYAEYLASQAASLTEPTIPVAAAGPPADAEPSTQADGHLAEVDAADAILEPRDDGPPVGQFAGDEDGSLSPRLRALEAGD